MATKSAIEKKGEKKAPGKKATPKRAKAAPPKGYGDETRPRSAREVGEQIERGEIKSGTTVSLNGGPKIPLERFEKIVLGSVEKLGPEANRIVVDVPTNLGGICGDGDLSMVQTIVSYDGTALLAATDGKVAALVGTTSECGPIAISLAAHSIPAPLAKPGALRFAHNPNKSELFGTEFAWADDTKGIWRQQPEAGAFPRLDDVFPFTDERTVVVGLSAENLRRLASAVNSANNPEGVSAVVLLITPPGLSGGTVDKPIGVLGDVGIGVIMPTGGAIRSAAVMKYNRLRGRLGELRAAAPKRPKAPKVTHPDDKDQATVQFDRVTGELKTSTAADEGTTGPGGSEESVESEGGGKAFEG